MSLRDLELLLQEVKGDCAFVVGRRVPQRSLQLSACTQEDTQELYKRGSALAKANTNSVKKALITNMKMT